MLTTTTSVITCSLGGKEMPVLCGICRQPVEHVEEFGSRKKLAGCYNCRNLAEPSVVSRLADDYIVAEAQLILNQALYDTLPADRQATFTRKLKHDFPHRFILDWLE